MTKRDELINKLKQRRLKAGDYAVNLYKSVVWDILTPMTRQKLRRAIGAVLTTTDWYEASDRFDDIDAVYQNLDGVHELARSVVAVLGRLVRGLDDVVDAIDQLEEYDKHVSTLRSA